MLDYIVTITIFFPAITAIFLLLLNDRKKIVFTSISSSVLTFLLSLVVFLFMTSQREGFSLLIIFNGLIH